MQAILIAAARHGAVMAPTSREKHSGGSGSLSSKEVSLADGTGEGTAPIAGTSASSDPDVLAGATGAATTASLNDDDYPESIAHDAGVLQESSEGENTARDSDEAPNRMQPSGTDDTSGQTAMTDEAAGIDLRNGSATPDAAAEK